MCMLQIIKFVNYENYKIFGHYNYMPKDGYKPCYNKRSVKQMS